MKNRTEILFGTIMPIFLGLVLFCEPISAATIFTDNFNGYLDGNLSGQGGWIVDGSNTNSFTVGGSTVFEGSKAIQLHAGFFPSQVKKRGALVSDGMVTFYLRVNSQGNGWVNLRESSANKLGAAIQYGGPASVLRGKIKYWDGGLGAYVDLGSIAADIWYGVQMQWRSSDKKVRYNIDGGAWTSFVSSGNIWLSGLDTVVLQANSSIIGSSAAYFDAIQENLINYKTPVLIVPGLLGTEMKKGDELLWADIFRMMNPLNQDSFMDSLAFNRDLISTDSGVYKNDVIRNPYNLYDYTDSLINEFINQGYIENENLFTFPYDWRYGVSGEYVDGKTNADLLQEKINEILQQTGNSKVDIVAHSMGGLVVKKYAMDNPASHHVGKAVFVGVPNTGAPESIKVLLQGDNLDVPGLNDQEIKKISENMPAVYDLLPSQQYYNASGSFIKIINWQDPFGIFTSEKDLDYQETKSFLAGDHFLNSSAINKSENLHAQTFDSFDLRTAGVDVYSINGCKTPTVGQIAEIRDKYIPDSALYAKYIITDEATGDGTVPLESADNFLADSSHVFYAIKPSHGKMMSQSGVRQQIVNLVAGSSLNVADNVITKAMLDANPGKCQLSGWWFWVRSPVSIEILDQYENRSGIAPDGSVQNNIPGAGYEVMGGRKFVFIPTDENQTYTINLTGEDAGVFTLGSSQISNGQIIKTEVFSNLPVTAELTGQVNINPADNTTALSLKQTPNNQVETILPSAVIGPGESEDLLAPSTTADIVGAAGQPGFYRSDVSINLKVADDNSGVLNVEYNLNNAEFQKVAGDTVTVNVSEEGSHTIEYFSTDKAGNNEYEQTINFVIDKTAPETVVEFDPNAKDLKLSGLDATQVVVADNDNVIILTDQAGNTTEIALKDKNRKKSMKAEIGSLKYNEVLVDISKNKLNFSWDYDKNGNLKKLEQHVRSKKNYDVSATYDGKETKITGKDFSGKIKEYFSGIKIIKIKTDKGDFKWSY